MDDGCPAALATQPSVNNQIVKTLIYKHTHVREFFYTFRNRPCGSIPFRDALCLLDLRSCPSLNTRTNGSSRAIIEIRLTLNSYLVSVPLLVLGSWWWCSRPCLPIPQGVTLIEDGNQCTTVFTTMCRRLTEFALQCFYFDHAFLPSNQSIVLRLAVYVGHFFL